MNNIKFQDIRLTGGFWLDRYELNAEVSIEAVYQQFEKTGRFDALRFNYDGSKPIHIYYDSDVAKWIEAVAYLIAGDRDRYSKYERVADELIECMADSQMENGYLNSYFQQIEPDAIFLRRDDHELYCAGHLMEAAVAYYEHTGKRKFLDIMIKYADYIHKVFVVECTAKFHSCGHEEIEIGLIKLFYATDNTRYLDMAGHFIKIRGVYPQESDRVVGNEKYTQNEKPVYELESAEGHAVRAVYLYTAMSEYASECGDEEMLKACKRLYADILSKMFVTGGVGSTRIGESFTVPYDLPNLTAYNETCASIGLMFFLRSLQRHNQDVAYADTIERIMYNSLLSSTSLSGKAFFYENPLEVRLGAIDRETSILPEHRTILPSPQRKEIFRTSCCPPNINRTIASISGYFLSEDDDTLYVNQFANCAYKGITVVTDYPLNGVLKIKIDSITGKYLAVRIPFWAEEYSVVANRKPVNPTIKNGYIVLDAQIGEYEISFPMTVRAVYANPLVNENAGRVAIMRGPVLYCMEAVDNGENLHALSIDIDSVNNAQLVSNYHYSLPDIIISGYRDNNAQESSSLYGYQPHKRTHVNLKFIPYYTFANRGATDMIVWVRGGHHEHNR